MSCQVVESLTWVESVCAAQVSALKALRDDLGKTQWHSLGELFIVIDARLAHITATSR